MKKEDYKKYLRDNITKKYKKSTNSKVNRVELDAKKIKDKLLISDKVDQLQKHHAYMKFNPFMREAIVIQKPVH